ncbi:hypothetical protein [Nocardia tengchongensis]|uniref:hypothetical protein n=1 Tax=Nocardia tengchongensis TaxID=2055889 RepID=UPI003684B84E
MSMIMASGPAAMAATIADGVPTYTSTGVWTGSAIMVLVLAALVIWVLIAGHTRPPSHRR